MYTSISIGDFHMYADFYLGIQWEDPLVFGFFEKSKIKVRGAGASVGSKALRINYRSHSTKNDAGWEVLYSRQTIGKGRDYFWYALCVSKEIGNSVVLTTEAHKYQDMENYLMRSFKLPLLHEWVEPIVNRLLTDRIITQPRLEIRTAVDGRTMPIHGEEVPLTDLICFTCGALTEEGFREVVSDMLKNKEIIITDEVQDPLNFENFDSYIKQYGKGLVDNLEKEIEPLMPLKGEVESLALYHKRLYPQQAACVNGIKALRRNGIRYGIMNEGMGVGKTIQGASVMESYAIDEFLRKNPDKTIKDAMRDGAINYRNIVICPGHLVEKWAEEIRSEVPHAKVVILNDLAQLVAIREEGKKPKGRNFYIIGKDFAKLGTQEAPIPTMVKFGYPNALICKDCYTEEQTVRYMKGVGRNAVCPSCGGNHAMPRKYTGWKKEKALVCPNCGELLLKVSQSGINWENPLGKDGDKEDKTLCLSPKDFASRTTTNSICYHCGTPLWGANAKPLDNGNHSVCGNRKSKWSKVTFFGNAKKKGRKSAFVLKGREMDLYETQKLPFTELDVKPQAAEYGPRKVAPATYIKKYLKGYFDFCILDEVHKFEGAGTAQATAAHALIEASKFSLGLTGTISNGTASSFYYLLFMLDPRRMKEKGFSWGTSDMLQFCHMYGCVETAYEVDENSQGYNSNSRGRKLGQPQVKPGISPLLFIDFLLDRCVFLDITDLSQFLPPLKESVEIVKLPGDVAQSYRDTIDTLKAATHEGEGRTVLSEMLTFGLSYPDKPFGRHPIMSAIDQDKVVAAVDNYDEYKDSLLPKEERLVEIVSKEIAEDRNCFVYATYTGMPETNVTRRLQEILEKHCNLSGKVEILEATAVEARKREAWIKEKAADGKRVIITNPKCVETGLDFCFDYQGRSYNYPTLIFYQMSYEMSVIWQASRRHYRLNQTEECRTYYLAYENTLQTAALEIMAAKQVATSAIQGKFSSEGLASMAKGVDTRAQLAAALAENDMGDRKSLENMFDVMNQTDANGDDRYDYIPPKTYYELMGEEEVVEEKTDEIDLFAAMSFTETKKTVAHKEPVVSRTVSKTKPVEEAMTGLFSSFDSLFAGGEISFSVSKGDEGRFKGKRSCEGQLSLANFFDVMGAA